MEREQELRLVARLKQGDERAFDELYGHFRARIFSFLARLAKSQAVAEDLSQEVWLRLATRAERLRDDTRAGAWLFAVARNLFISYCRNRLLDAARVGELGRMSLLPASPASPFEAAAAGETEHRMERALAALPLRYREALLLVAYEGLAPEEAAVICELRPDAFRKRLSRARQMLEAILQKGETA